MTPSPTENTSAGPEARTNANAAPALASRKIVFHRKKLSTKKKFSKAVSSSFKRGVPAVSSSKRGLPTAQPLHAPQADGDEDEDEDKDKDKDNEFDEILPLHWVQNGAPSDTLLAIQSFGMRPETSLAIPISSYQTPPVVRGILDSQLYPVLQDDTVGDTAVSLEIQELIMAGSICKLSAPLAGKKSQSLSILLLTSDYQRAVQDAVERHNGLSAVASWFVHSGKDWTTSRISLQDLETSYNHHGDGGDANANDKYLLISRQYSLQQVLRELLRIQVLLPCHSTNTYQLWLPEWGTVLKAWERASTNLLRFLGRSQRQERSEQSMLKQDPYSPIPRHLVLNWLTAHGRVQVVERPYGKFVQLVEIKQSK
jgi:hypothetical protein